MDSTFDSFGWQPRFVAGCAVGVVAAIAYLAFGQAASVNVSMLAAALCVSIGALVALTRTPMPTHIRTVLMLALIVSVLCLALKSNFLLLQPVQERLDHALDYGNDGDSRTPGAIPRRSADIVIHGLDVDLPFAREARARLAGFADDIPGASDWRISADTLSDDQGASVAMSISWRVSGLGGDVDCGELSIDASDPEVALAALRERFRRAIRQSATARHAACE